MTADNEINRMYFNSFPTKKYQHSYPVIVDVLCNSSQIAPDFQGNLKAMLVREY